jgi:hypothetical protein
MLPASIENTQIFSAVPCSYGGLFHPGCSLSAGKKARVCEAYACALVLSGRRAKKPIHDGSQKNELNGYNKRFVTSRFYAYTTHLVLTSSAPPAYQNNHTLHTKLTLSVSNSYIISSLKHSLYEPYRIKIKTNHRHYCAR